MKPLTLLLIAALTASAASRPDLHDALTRAEAAWGLSTPEPITIEYGNLGPCSPMAIRRTYGLTVFATHTIVINQACHWDRPGSLLETVVAHEYGHILLMRPDHSTDRASVMYGIVHSNSQKITINDLRTRK